MLKTILICHMASFLAGYLLDLIIGDPHSFPHPVRVMGNMISCMDRRWNSSDPQKALKKGRIMVFTVTSLALLTSAAVLALTYYIHPVAGGALEAVMTYQVIAAKGLKDESMKVYKELKAGDLNRARLAVSMIVGRDTDVLDEAGVAKAAIETVAENTSDGVIAPLFYAALGGPALGMWYKAVNTMDSMVGYKNDKYLHFGRAAALLDDAVNYIPSRISAFFMCISCVFAGPQYSVRDAFRIHKRDCRNHASPNSAQTESACAGALGIKLLGNASYFGIMHKKPFVGDEKRPVEYEDIRRANKLMYITALLFVLASLILMGIVFWLQLR